MKHVVVLLALVGTVHADDADDAPPIEEPPIASLGGYIETYYSLNFRRPSNRITNLRAFDNRDRTFTLSNVALAARARRGPVSADIVLQVGSTPSTYYAAEPTLPGTASVAANNGEMWKYIQQAVLAYAGPGDLVFDAGLVPSPTGPEAIAVKDNWNWSRSNLFFGLPFYHTGLRVSYPLSDGWRAMLHVYSGWNSVVDNNETPSVGLSAAYTSKGIKAQLLYLGGIERPSGAPEGNAWRNLFDGYVSINVRELSFQLHADGGIEPNAFGTSGWLAGALYAKVQLSSLLFAAARVDLFREWVAGTAAPIFWPTEWIGSATGTLAVQPSDGISIRLEMRHDQAKREVFFGGSVEGDGVTMPYVPDRRAQETITLGATAWF